MKKVILNQKSYFFYDDMVKFKNSFDKLKTNDYEFIIFPPILYLSMFKDSKYKVGTQNFFGYKMGSFTGELNLESLKKIGINYTLIGHFERRKIVFESYEMAKEKLFKSLGSKCNTILCVGEVKKTRKPFNYIKKELNYYLRSIDSSTLKYLSIAYEPNWAIGTGEIHHLCGARLWNRETKSGTRTLFRESRRETFPFHRRLQGHHRTVKGRKVWQLYH